MIAPIAVSAMPSFQDPLVVLVAKWREEVKAWEATDHDSLEDDAAWERRRALAQAIKDTKPETLSGLRAQFSFFRSDFGDFISDALGPEDMAFLDRMISSLGEIRA